jgi:hypothetical protein
MISAGCPIAKVPATVRGATTVPRSVPSRRRVKKVALARMSKARVITGFATFSFRASPRTV